MECMDFFFSTRFSKNDVPSRGREEIEGFVIVIMIPFLPLLIDQKSRGEVVRRCRCHERQRRCRCHERQRARLRCLLMIFVQQNKKGESQGKNVTLEL